MLRIRMRIKVKDLKKGMRFAEDRVRTTFVAQEDARLIDETNEYGERSHGYFVIGLSAEGKRVHFFEHIDGSPYGPHLYTVGETDAGQAEEPGRA